MEDLLYEVESVRRFVGLRLSGALPDETTILNFRHLLEKHGLGEALFEEINAHLASLGHRLERGTIVDASIIAAPSSTKNRTGERDPEMRQTKKGNRWYFGMKAHVGVDAQSGLAHRLGDDACERIGRGHGARAAARGRGACVGRRGLPGGGHARGEPGRGGGVGGRDEARPAPVLDKEGRRRRRRGARRRCGRRWSIRSCT